MFDSRAMRTAFDLRRPTHAIVDLSAIASNVSDIRDRIGPDRRLMAVVKADAYGHGSIQVARTALENGADCLGVAIPEEGLALRQAGIDAPILVFGFIQPEEADKIVAARLEQSVGSIELLDALNDAGKAGGDPVRVHLKIDTGMGRLGVPPHQALTSAREIVKRKHLRLAGVFSHFCTADCADKTYTRLQMERFDSALHDIETAGIDPGLRHIANSAGVLAHPNSYYDMVRPGIMIYGLYPSRDVERTVRLQPAMHFVTRISALKTAPAGSSISYGRTYITRNGATKIATLPVGYADGFSRLLSNNAVVTIRGQSAPIVGTVCMDMCMADVSAIDVARVGDEVVLFGDGPSADDIARRSGTINYEVTCRVSKRVPRIYANSQSTRGEAVWPTSF